MTNREKFNQAFIEVFGVEESALSAEFTKENVESWDSVHQLNIIAILEETFDIMMDPEDIMELTSYARGEVIMAKYDVEL